MLALRFVDRRVTEGAIIAGYRVFGKKCFEVFFVTEDNRAYFPDRIDIIKNFQGNSGDSFQHNKHCKYDNRSDGE